MLDTAIGPIIRVLDGNSFQMQVTHVGRHNAYSYNTYETVYIAPKQHIPNATKLTAALVGRRVRCHVRYRDNFNRLFSDVEFDQNS